MKNFILLITSLFIFLIFSQTSSYAQISFFPAETFKLGSSIKSVAIGDVNNDGLNDAVIATNSYFSPEYDYHVIVFLQNQNGTLDSPVKYKHPDCFGSQTVIQIDDVNNDLLNDIVIAYGDSLGVYFQNQSGGLNPLKSFYSGNDVDGMKTGDLNNDLLTDIVVCHWNEEYIKVFYQSENNNFLGIEYPVESGGRDEIDIADINNDDLNDIIFMPGQNSSGTLNIFYQEEVTGINPTPLVLNYEIAGSNRFRGIGIGDINNDGKNDIVGSIGNAWITLIHQDNSGGFEDAVYIPAYNNPTPVEIADLNCDGRNEIIVGHDGWSHFSVYEQDSLNSYNKYNLHGSLYYIGPYGLAVGDFNNDSRKDVLTHTGFTYPKFNYSSTAPNNLLYSDTTVNLIHYSQDTIQIIGYDYNESIVDTINECLIETITEGHVTAIYVYYEMEGDTVVNREFEMCDNLIKDSIYTYFDVVFSIVYRDTSEMVITIDTLYEDYLILDFFQTSDTIDTYTEYKTDTIVKQYIYIQDEIIFTVTDSLLITRLLSVVNIIESGKSVFEGKKCGVFVQDTLVQWEYPYTDVRTIEIDTILISHTVQKETLDFTIYPNPAKLQCKIKVNSALPSTEKMYLKVYSVSGELLKSMSFFGSQEEVTLDIKGLKNGLYIVFVHGDEIKGSSTLIIGN